MINGFLYGVSFAIEFALGTLILVGLFNNVWKTARISQSLFWALGWSAFAMSFSSFMKAIGDASLAFEIFSASAQILFHALVLTYVVIYSVEHWGDHENV